MKVKSEARNPNYEGIPRSEYRRAQLARPAWHASPTAGSRRLRLSGFGLVSEFCSRLSDIAALPPLVVFLCFAATLNGLAADSTNVPLWSGVAPGSEGLTNAEQVQERGVGIHDRRVSNIIEPTVEVFLAPTNKASGTAVIICPGGGYAGVCIDKEGRDAAAWLNSIGVSGFVLKYRLPNTKSRRLGHEVPLMDAQRALRLVRARASGWGVQTNRIGIMGFSAGGHLASTAATHFDAGKGDASDPTDRLDCRPDFAVLIYPVVSMQPPFAHEGSRKALLGENPDPDLVKLFSNDLQVTKATPPVFLVSTSDDGVKAENSIEFYFAARKAGVPAELHVFQKGGHGYGLRKESRPGSNWPVLCESWLRERGLLERVGK